jgi:hypothetical protein
MLWKKLETSDCNLFLSFKLGKGHGMRYEKYEHYKKSKKSKSVAVSGKKSYEFLLT